MLKFISKLQWLFWVGFLGVILDNQYLTLFFLFGLCGFANVFSPMRNDIHKHTAGTEETKNVKFLYQLLRLQYTTHHQTGVNTVLAVYMSFYPGA